MGEEANLPGWSASAAPVGSSKLFSACLFLQKPDCRVIASRHMQWGAEHSFGSLCKAAPFPSVWLYYRCSLGFGSLQADSWECHEPCMPWLPPSSQACNHKLD